MATMVRRIHQKGQGHLEDVLDLMGVGLEGQGGVHPGHHRRDLKGGHGSVGGQLADHLHPVGGQPHFLLRLAQGGMGRAGVAVLHPPTWKADLARMGAQVRGALCEQHRGPLAGGQRRHGLHQGTGGEDAAVLQQLQVGRRPALLSDRFTRQVHHRLRLHQGLLQRRLAPTGGVGGVGLQAGELRVLQRGQRLG